jgi:hypothetical protein
MKASPSSYVIVFVGSEKLSTLDADIRPSFCVLRANQFYLLDHAKTNRSSQAKNRKSGSQRGQACDISARGLLRNHHGQCWYGSLISDAICRNSDSAKNTFEQCKGDLSIRLIFSTDCVLRYRLPTTFSASKGRA